MFSIKCQEVVDKNTGVHLAFGDHGKDKSTVWVRITAHAEPGIVGSKLARGPDKITTITFHRDGDVINIAPAQVTNQVVEQKPHVVPPPKEPLRPDEKKPKS